MEATIVVTPQETIKTKLVALNETSLQRGVSSIIKTDGMSGLYRGLVPTAVKQSTNQGIRFMVFSTYKNALLEYKSTKSGKKETKTTTVEVLLIYLY